MTPPLDDEMVKQTIHEHLSSFHSALRYNNSTEKINSFLSSFSAFANNIRKHHDKLQQDTLVTAGGFFSAINSLATNILQLDSNIEKLQQEATEELANLSLNDNEKSEPSPEPTRCPAYVKPSIQWLLQNLHNPYPSKETKKEISRQTKCPLKDIDAWFSDARKRIGWNKLRKTRFSNKQDKIIAAATLVFRPKTTSFSSDLSIALSDEVDSNESYRSEFLAVAKRASSLYADKFPELVLSTLDSVHQVVPSYTPRNRIEEQHLNVATPPQITMTFFSYPTPEYSPSPQPSPPATPSHNVQVLSSSLRKRRNSHLEIGDEQCHDRACKRTKFDTAQENHIPTSLNLLPIPVIDLSTDPVPDSYPSQSDQVPFAGITETSMRKRKRRLSDGEGGESRKRPHNSLCVPRLQTVSDPLPTPKILSENPFDQWIESNVADEHLSDAIPLPASAGDEISLDNPLDLHFHQYIFPFYMSKENTENGLVSNETLGILSFPPGPSADSLDDGADMQFPLIPPATHPDSNFHANILEADTTSLFCRNSNLSSFPGNIFDSTQYFGDAHASHLSNTIVGGISTDRLNHALSIAQEQFIKRARAQALREELALYEAEGL